MGWTWLKHRILFIVAFIYQAKYLEQILNIYAKELPQ